MKTDVCLNVSIKGVTTNLWKQNQLWNSVLKALFYAWNEVYTDNSKVKKEIGIHLAICLICDDDLYKRRYVYAQL